MSDSVGDRGCSGDDESVRQFQAALTWEAGGKEKRLSLLLSLLVHMIVVVPFCLMGISVHREVPVSDIHKVATLVLVPKNSLVPPLPLQTSIQLPAEVGLPLPDDSGGAPGELTVELSSMSLGFAVDVGNQLQAVVRRTHGELALLEKGDRDHAQYLFEPPDWHRNLGPRNISDKFLVLMEPARDWKVFRDLAAQYDDIDLSQYYGAALFDMRYRLCLMDAIRTKVRSNTKAGGRVISAQLAFTVDSPCGVIALEVEVAPRSGR
jgi:hypothetical protein